MIAIAHPDDRTPLRPGSFKWIDWLVLGDGRFERWGKPYSDAELSAAWERLVELAEPIVFRRRGNEPHLLHLVVCKALLGLLLGSVGHKFDPDFGNPLHYVRVILLRLTKETIRQECPRPIKSERLVSREDVAEDPHTTAWRNERTEGVRRIFGGLSPEERCLLVKRFGSLCGMPGPSGRLTGPEQLQLRRLLIRLRTQLSPYA